MAKQKKKKDESLLNQYITPTTQPSGTGEEGIIIISQREARGMRGSWVRVHHKTVLANSIAPLRAFRSS
jgi:hypothetical protein